MNQIQTKEDHTTIGTWALAINRALKGKGFDSAPIFKEVGIDLSSLKNPDFRIPVSTMHKLWRKATELTEDDAFGLTVAENVFPTHLSALLFALQSSGSLKECANRIVRYAKVVTTVGCVTTREEQGDLIVEFINFAEPDSFPTEPLEALLATAAKTFRDIMEDPDRGIREVRFRRPIPAHPERYEAFFNCPVIFNAAKNEIRIRGEVANKPLPGANSAIADIQDQLLNDYLKRLDRKNLRLQVKEKVLALIPSGEVTQDDVASYLNMSSRTLHRKLAEEDITFKQLLDNVKKDLALRYLKNPTISIVEVTYTLGFTDQSSFTRAFKRWMSCTPSQYRDEL